MPQAVNPSTGLPIPGAMGDQAIPQFIPGLEGLPQARLVSDQSQLRPFEYLRNEGGRFYAQSALSDPTEGWQGHLYANDPKPGAIPPPQADYSGTPIGGYTSIRPGQAGLPQPGDSPLGPVQPSSSGASWVDPAANGYSSIRPDGSGPLPGGAMRPAVMPPPEVDYSGTPQGGYAGIRPGETGGPSPSTSSLRPGAPGQPTGWVDPAANGYSSIRPGGTASPGLSPLFGGLSPFSMAGRYGGLPTPYGRRGMSQAPLAGRPQTGGAEPNPGQQATPPTINPMAFMSGFRSFGFPSLGGLPQPR